MKQQKLIWKPLNKLIVTISRLKGGLYNKRNQEQEWEETECRYKDEAGGSVEKQFLFEGAFWFSHLIA